MNYLTQTSSLESDRTSATKIVYNGSSKVIRRICQILNCVARLGITHDTAFYGDLGQSAYNHSQVVSGNPHKVTLEDLGIPNIRNQITLVLDAVGSLNLWICQDDNYEFTDHDGNNLVFVAGANLLAWH